MRMLQPYATKRSVNEGAFHLPLRGWPAVSMPCDDLGGSPRTTRSDPRVARIPTAHMSGDERGVVLVGCKAHILAPLALVQRRVASARRHYLRSVNVTVAVG